MDKERGLFFGFLIVAFIIMDIFRYIFKLPFFSLPVIGSLLIVSIVFVIIWRRFASKPDYVKPESRDGKQWGYLLLGQGIIPFAVGIGTLVFFSKFMHANITPTEFIITIIFLGVFSLIWSRYFLRKSRPE
jgi:hypothetical protein